MNKILLEKQNGEEISIDNYDGICVNFTGENSLIKIYEGTQFHECSVICGHGTKIFINRSRFPIHRLNIFSNEGVNNLVKIGVDFSCWGCDLKCLGRSQILIGNDCQFSYEIALWNTDGHTIFDKDGFCINPIQDVIIGNHVWIGHRVEILKGAIIPDNSVVGACSLVNKKFTKPNIILAGIPASVIKEDIRWDRLNPTYFTNCR